MVHLMRNRAVCLSNWFFLNEFPRSSYLITMVFMFITAFVLAEICSALPLSGSIYIWAAESAGPKYARFFGFVVAWWSTTAWMTFTAGNCQVNKSMAERPHFILLVLRGSKISFLTEKVGNGELHRVAASRVGYQLSRRHRER